MPTRITYSIDECWEAVSARVCWKCVDSDGDGNCRLPRGQHCELRNQFPKIVDTIVGVASDSMEPYVEALRRNICSQCVSQGPNSTCRFRSELDCGLDRYFPMIVEVVEGLYRPRA